MSSSRSREKKMRREKLALDRAKTLRGGLGGEIVTLKDGEMGRSKSFADRILERVHTLKEPPKVAVLPPQPPPKLEMPKPNVAPAPSLIPPPTPVAQPAPQIKVEPLVTQSHNQKELIWKMAQENQDFYLLAQMEDKRPGGPKPWFMYPRYPHQYSEFVMLTKEMAKVALEHLWSKDEGNRNKKPALVEAYKRDIDNDRWIPTDEAIGINLSFEVYNGQHRLWAIFESGKPMPMYITWNVLDEAKFFVESGAKRTLAERLKMVVDPPLGNRTSGFCKAIMRGLGTRLKYTDSDIAEFACKWDDLLNWVHTHLPVARAEVQAVVAKAYLWYGPEKIEPFCYRLRELKFPDDGDPAKALFRSLDAAKKNRSNVTLVAYRKTLQAIDALVTGRPISKLHESSDDIFEWQDGWELPPNAPSQKKA